MSDKNQSNKQEIRIEMPSADLFFIQLKGEISLRLKTRYKGDLLLLELLLEWLPLFFSKLINRLAEYSIPLSLSLTLSFSLSECVCVFCVSVFCCPLSLRSGLYIVFPFCLS